MQIRDLQSTSTVESTDYLVKEQSDGTTQKIAVGDFVVNNLTNTATDKPLSAAQGKTLNDALQPLLKKDMTWKDVDANKCVTTGFYPISGSTNVPSAWGILFVIAVRYDTIRQIYLGDSGSLYIRGYQNRAWSAWREFSYQT